MSQVQTVRHHPPHDLGTQSPSLQILSMGWNRGGRCGGSIESSVLGPGAHQFLLPSGDCDQRFTGKLGFQKIYKERKERKT